MTLPMLKIIRKPAFFPYSVGDLEAFPNGTLGKDLVNFLQAKELTLLPYYARHDIKHILLGYDTTDAGEGCLQCFMLGNKHVSFPVLATVAYCFLTMPEYWGTFLKAFTRGNAAPPIANWKWFEILGEPTDALKRKLDSVQTGKAIR
jgi:ubiquinone biosynthesis protein Coq4